MMSLSRPNALLFLQLLIAFITRSAVNIRAISNDFLLDSLVTIRVSFEEVCLPIFEVLNCWLNLVASCLDDENECNYFILCLAFYSAINSLNRYPQLGRVCLMVHGFNNVSIFCRVCTQMRFWMSLFHLCSSGEVESLLWRSSRLFITFSICADTGSSWSMWHPVGMWCDAALSRTVRKIFSSLWQSFGRVLVQGILYFLSVFVPVSLL